MLLTANERDSRTWKLRATKAEKKLEAQQAAKANKREWERGVEEWLTVFPDVPKPRSLSVKSARATEFFARQDRGATVDDILDAIHGAKQRPYLRYGRRTDKPGSNSERAVDLSDIVKTTGAHADANFDLLCELGRAARSEGPGF